MVLGYGVFGGLLSGSRTGFSGGALGLNPRRNLALGSSSTSCSRRVYYQRGTT